MFQAAAIGQDVAGRPLPVSAAIDLTVLQEAERALAAREAEFRGVFEQAAVGLAQVGLDGRWLRVNGRASAILGHAEAELLGRRFQEITHPDDLAAELERMRALLDGGVPTYAMEKRYRRGDGMLAWATTTVSLLRDGAGRPDRFIMVLEDIAARKAAEAALAETEARQRELLATLDLGAFMACDLDGTIRFWSKGCERLYGWTAEEAIGQVSHTLLHTEFPPPQAAGRAGLERDGSWASDLRQRTRDGETRIVESRKVLRRGPAGAPLALLETVHDVTAQRQAEAALRESTAVMLLSQDAARVGSYVQDLRTDAYRWAPGAPTLFGFPPGSEAMPMADWLAIRHPEDRLRTAAERARSLARGDAEARYEYRIIRPDTGELRHLEARARREHDADGRPVRAFGVVFDVTEARLAEAAGRERAWRDDVLLGLEERLRASRTVRDTAAAACEALGRALGLVHAALGAVEPDGVHVVVEGGWRADGRTAASGRHRLADLPPERLAPLFQGNPVAIADPLTAGSPVAQQAFEALGARASLAVPLRQDGRLRAMLFLLRAAPQGWTAAEIELARTTLDRTWQASERARAEAALRDNEERLRLAQDAAAIGIWDWDLASGTQRWSARNFSLLGLDPVRDEPSHANWHAAIHPDDRAAIEAAVAAALGGVDSYEAEYRVAAPEGEPRWLLARGVVLREPGGRATRMLGVTLDVTATKIVETALARDNAELETRVAERTRALTEAAAALQAEMQRREAAQAALVQAQKLEALGQLTGSVAHDFNNVLAAVMGSLRLITRRAEGNERVIDLARNGERAAERAAALVRQLLAFARREDLLPVLVDPVALLANTDQMLRRAVGSGVTLSVEAAAGTWPVLADPHRLEVALLNLSMNARDAMQGSGGLLVTVRNAPAGGEARPPGLDGRADHVVLTVRDSGTGMPPEVLARAAEPFFTTKPRGKGTGLGLAMVHGFAQQSGGALRLLSAPGEGTTAEIWLPRAAPEDAATPGHAPAEPDPALHGAATLLVVDDDDQVRLVTASQLRELGYAVLEASSVASAMAQALAAERLDLVVTDVTMPGGNGQELARRLRAARPGVPLLFLTGFNDRQSLDGEVVLGKPFTAAEFSRQVLAALGRLPAPLHDRLLMRLSRAELREAYFAWRRRRDELGGTALPWIAPAEIAALSGADDAYTVAVEPDGEAPPRLRFLQVGAALAARPDSAQAGQAVDDGTEADEAFGGLTVAFQRAASLGVPCHDYARYCFQDGGDRMYFERLLLPLAADHGPRPTHLLGIALFSGPV
ncbi:PAS domain S-box protein [Dankookia sp. GCM10030260]|uniref:PAS domain S-box protein n=1 Tax=Dankookia sp. GCM10030260 TaxID=3273390 RepID=UPI0036068D8E